VDANRRRTVGLLLAGLLLAVGTPGLVGLVRPGVRFYLLQPPILLWQAIPYLLAGALWLPFRSPPGTTIGRRLAGLLLLTAGLLHVPMLIGIFPLGGDMVGMVFVYATILTTLAIVVTTLIAYGVLYLGRRKRAGT